MDKDNSSQGLVLARRYRPSRFTELVGQDVLAQILMNSCVSKRIAHAFLLSGIRGTGKTTTARIIALALNCLKEDSPVAEPCGTCDNCRAIIEGSSVDVVEMDAASHTGVDHMRELIERAQYKPMSSRYKIYILDEAHMLSKAAFNALLKTLEEPPPHMIFILATTEPERVPVTIRSRCQHHKLQRVKTEVLQEHFLKISEQEQKNLDDKAALLIAQLSEGSVRDGLSLLDTAMAAHQTITEETIRAMVGLANRQDTEQLFSLIMAHKSDETLAHIRTLYHQGAECDVIARDLLHECHKNMTQLLSEDEAHTNPQFFTLHRLWQLLLAGYDEILKAPLPLEALEMLALRAIHILNVPHMDELLQNLSAVTKPQKEATPPKEEAKSEDLLSQAMEVFPDAQKIENS